MRRQPAALDAADTVVADRKTIRLLDAVIGIDLGNTRHAVCVIDGFGDAGAAG